MVRNRKARCVYHVRLDELRIRRKRLKEFAKRWSGMYSPRVRANDAQGVQDSLDDAFKTKRSKIRRHPPIYSW